MAQSKKKRKERGIFHGGDREREPFVLRKSTCWSQNAFKRTEPEGSRAKLKGWRPRTEPGIVR